MSKIRVKWLKRKIKGSSISVHHMRVVFCMNFWKEKVKSSNPKIWFLIPTLKGFWHADSATSGKKISTYSRLSNNIFFKNFVVLKMVEKKWQTKESTYDVNALIPTPVIRIALHFMGSVLRTLRWVGIRTSYFFSLFWEFGENALTNIFDEINVSSYLNLHLEHRFVVLSPR